MKIEVVSTLKRKAGEVIARLASDREEVLITQNGQPSAYLVDVNTFHEMRERLLILEGLARGEKAIRENRIVSHSEARQRMKKWLE